jgi:hypothetical protein
MWKHTVQEFLGTGGRLCHLRDRNKKRVITVAYWASNNRYERQNPNDNNTAIFYGASIFQYDNTEPVFTKAIRRMNNQQAIDRCCNNPIDIDDPAAGLHPFLRSHLRIGQLDFVRRQYLREAIHINGVQDLDNDPYDTFQEMLRTQKAQRIHHA